MMGDPESSRIAIPARPSASAYTGQPGASGSNSNVLAVRPVADLGDPARGSAPAGDLASNKPAEQKFSVSVPANANFTRPYFSRPDLEQSYYDIGDDGYLNQPLSPYPVAGWAEYSYDGAPVRVGQYVQTTKRVAGMGSVSEPLVVGPAIGVQIAPRHGVVPLDVKSFPVTVVINSNAKGPAKGSIRLDVPAGWGVEPRNGEFSLATDGQQQSATFTVTPASLAEKTYQIKAVAEYAARSIRKVTTSPATPACDLTISIRQPLIDDRSGREGSPGLKVGYVTGTGDDVPASLEHLGVKVVPHAERYRRQRPGEVRRRFTWVRTYAAREDLRTHSNRLLDYVKNGGVVIVQYNTPEFDSNYGPDPYTMGRNPEEVTDEVSKVNILAPANPILIWPKKKKKKDFTGWVEERGSKWMQTWDPHYEAVLETHDEGQEPQKGGLLYARYGKGVYIYNAYAFYRQLPEGVPGAYRIFANMLSLAKNPSR
jgi:hypothetical protein